MSKLYSDWLGKSVVLRLSSDGLNVALRCVLLGESANKPHIRFGDFWVVYFHKNMVQSAEEHRQFWPC